MDDSYLHLNHMSEVSGFEIDGYHHSAHPKDDGQRNTVVHTLTEEGPVNDGGREGGTKEEVPNAQGLFISEGWKACF